MAITTAELLIKCKKALHIADSSTIFDSELTQKLLTVKGFLLGAGVKEIVIDSDVAIGTIIQGVGDIWILTAGEVKFSPVFYILANQLKTKAVAENV